MKAKIRCILLLVLVFLTMTACTQEDIGDFLSPLRIEGACAQAQRTGEEGTMVELNDDRIHDIFSMLHHAEILPAEDAMSWDAMEYQLTLTWEDCQLQMGYDPIVPNAVYAQWLRGGAYSGPVWLVGATLPGKLISYIPGQSSTWTMAADWQTISDGQWADDDSLDDTARLAVTLHCLFESQSTDLAPMATKEQPPDLTDYRVIDLRICSDVRTHTYRYYAYLQEDTWYIEVPDVCVYRISPEAIAQCEEYLTSDKDALQICSGDQEITVSKQDVDGNMYGLPLLPVLETKTDALGMPFTVSFADGTSCKWYRARITRVANTDRWVEGASPRYANDYLGDRCWSLALGHPHMVMLTVYQSASQLFDGGGSTYYFKIIPR